MSTSAIMALHNSAVNGRGKPLALRKENEPVGGEPPWPTGT
jgi:hypothetical protein